MPTSSIQVGFCVRPRAKLEYVQVRRALMIAFDGLLLRLKPDLDGTCELVVQARSGDFGSLRQRACGRSDAYGHTVFQIAAADTTTSSPIKRRTSIVRRGDGSR